MKKQHISAHEENNTGRTHKFTPTPMHVGVGSDAKSGRGFADAVRRIVASIPKGETLTYGQVAERAGKPRAARAVGNILSTNYDLKIPCHRVIRSDGKTGGYNRGEQKKKILLEKEREWYTS